MARRQHDVLGAKRTVQHTARMRMLERFADLDCDRQTFLDIHRSGTQPIRQRGSFDKRQHTERQSVSLAEVKQRKDVWMVQLGCRAVRIEEISDGGIAGMLRHDHLQGNIATVLEVARKKHVCPALDIQFADALVPAPESLVHARERSGHEIGDGGGSTAFAMRLPGNGWRQRPLHVAGGGRPTSSRLKALRWRGTRPPLNIPHPHEIAPVEGGHMATKKKRMSASKSASPVQRAKTLNKAAKVLRRRPAATHRPKQIVSIDVKVTYRQGGKLKEMWLDTSRVHGMVWDLNSGGTTVPGPGCIDTGPSSRPRRKAPPVDLGDCAPKRRGMKTLAAQRQPACCWWNGKKWICPDEFE